MTEVLLLAIALSMDAFAVSIGLGSKKNSNIASFDLALKAGTFFGFFQAIMPIVGYLGGKGLLGWICSYTHWISFGLLGLIGAKMIYEGMSEGVEKEICYITNKVMLLLSIATSIDAMAAGFSLMLLNVNPFLACFIIGIVTFMFSFIGVFVGKLSGTWLESKAEIFGGIVLIAIGFRMLFY
ncbi:MAG: manganese efflux pump MntP family protein [Sulfurospirillaceae bacterium]|nr:manganese efflux pump MntP family protein [Sulfurospirillaceae bacterium]MDD3462408.1 manganese efflux pump MntP family protein [Sulfurospirillaceae bacterium]